MGCLLTTTTLTPLQRMWTLPDEVAPAWSARRRLADSLRQAIDRCVRTEADSEALAAAQGHIEQALALLPQGRTSAEAFADASYFSAPAVYVDRGALFGRCNPIAPPLVARWEGDRSVVEVVLPEAYVGAPGMVHGGVVASIFDQVFGHCVIMNGTSGLTGKLTVSYPRPTRLHRKLRWEAWLVSREGRRIELAASVSDTEGVTARAEATFIELAPDRATAVIRGTPPKDS